MRLLLVEDDHDLAETLEAGLEEMNYTVDVAHDGIEGEMRGRSGDYAVIIVDWMLPGQDGPELIRQLRDGGIHTPVLMLTAKADIEDKVGGLDAGADDYLTKPFAFEELFARLRALMRRDRRAELQRVLEAGSIQLDTSRHQVHVEGEEIELRPKTYRVLELLLRRKGSVVTRTGLAEHVWGSVSGTTDDVINMTISDLRQQLRDVSERAAQQVETVRGMGYRVRE